VWRSGEKARSLEREKSGAELEAACSGDEERASERSGRETVLQSSQKKD
jgi:hypothetical protein